LCCLFRAPLSWRCLIALHKQKRSRTVKALRRGQSPKPGGAAGCVRPPRGFFPNIAIAGPACTSVRYDARTGTDVRRHATGLATALCWLGFGDAPVFTCSALIELKMMSQLN
jgi:hypothetical protein